MKFFTFIRAKKNHLHKILNMYSIICYCSEDPLIVRRKTAISGQEAYGFQREWYIRLESARPDRK